MMQREKKAKNGEVVPASSPNFETEKGESISYIGQGGGPNENPHHRIEGIIQFPDHGT